MKMVYHQPSTHIQPTLGYFSSFVHAKLIFVVGLALNLICCAHSLESPSSIKICQVFHPHTIVSPPQYKNDNKYSFRVKYGMSGARRTLW